MLTLRDKGTVICKILRKKGHKGGKVDLVSVDDKLEPSDKTGDVIYLDSGEDMELVPTVKYEGKNMVPVRDILYVCGQSGAGKSTIASVYIKNFNKLFPKKKVYVFSRLESDEVLDKLKICRMPLTMDLVTNPINIHTECEEGSLILFDDCDTIADSSIRNAIMALMKDVLETGRHKNIYCIITSHLLTRPNRVDNNTIYNELHRLIIFRCGNRVAKKRVLEIHFGFDKKTADGILNNTSRWICIGKNYPNYMIWDKGAKIIS